MHAKSHARSQVARALNQVTMRNDQRRVAADLLEKADRFTALLLESTLTLRAMAVRLQHMLRQRSAPAAAAPQTDVPPGVNG